MIDAMQDAARRARKASTIRTRRRVVEIFIVEAGVYVVGRYNDARHAFHAAELVEWPVLERNPRLVPNAVMLVIRRLEEKGEELGITPVREGE